VHASHSVSPPRGIRRGTHRPCRLGECFGEELKRDGARAWRGKWLGSTSPYHVHHAAKKQETTTEGPSPAWQAMSSLGYPVPPTPLPRSSAAHQTVVPTCTRPDLARWADRPPGPHYVVVKHRSPTRDPRYYRSLLFRITLQKNFEPTMLHILAASLIFPMIVEVVEAWLWKTFAFFSF
jgi:hypothetical protein